MHMFFHNLSIKIATLTEKMFPLEALKLMRRVLWWQILPSALPSCVFRKGKKEADHFIIFCWLELNLLPCTHQAGTWRERIHTGIIFFSGMIHDAMWLHTPGYYYRMLEKQERIRCTWRNGVSLIKSTHRESIRILNRVIWISVFWCTHTRESAKKNEFHSRFSLGDLIYFFFMYTNNSGNTNCLPSAHVLQLTYCSIVGNIYRFRCN